MVTTASDIQGCVLVMDHDPARSASRHAQLISDGWQALLARDPAGALAAVQSGDVDAVVLDVSTEEAEALDLPRVLRVASGVPHLPIIVMAPAPPEQIRCQFLEGGADDILPNDISPAELGARLRALMRVKRLHDELRASRQALAASLARERQLLAQLRRDNAHLLTLCTTDPLTHLQNIRHFNTFLASEFKVARRYQRKLSLLVFDLDHFKVVNDTHGHPSGDYVLKEFAVILERLVRDSDVVARTGGEEFSIVLPNAGRTQAQGFAQRIGKAVCERKFIVYGQEIHVTTSVGAASYPDDVEIADAEMLLYFADQALLRAKQLGRDRAFAFGMFDPVERRRLKRQYLASCSRRTDRDGKPAIASTVGR